MMKRYLILIALMLFTVPVLADDGQLFRKDVSKTPDLETEGASLNMMPIYVPAVSSTGESVTINYYAADGSIIQTRDQAKPQVAFYSDGHVESIEDSGGFSGHGHRDIFGAVSMDDGATWKRSNLSRSGDLSSFTLKDGTPYPGDVIRQFDAVAGNKVLAVWASRYCRGGNPAYAMKDTTSDELLYEDFFGVGGSQGSSDFTDEGYPTVGEVPYSCMWAARGTLEQVDATNPATTYKIVWRQPERLTSGTRDAHRMEVAGVDGAGFVVTWQEDPEGMRPGDGEGPGEGWSGAVAHHQTDIWYSYIGWDDFDLVDNDGIPGAPVPLTEFTGDGVPPVGVPMSIPVRLTDNAMCQEGDSDPYCSHDFNGNGIADFCAKTVTVNIETPEGPTGAVQLCQTEDGRLLRGNIAATRARTNLRGYTRADGTKSAWVITAYEESKGLGEEEFDAGDASYEIGKMDMGKNIWYHTFDMFHPELVSQGMILNQPATYPADFVIPKLTSTDGDALVRDGDFMLIKDDPIYAFTEPPVATTLYQTEIARRFSLISQDASKAGSSGTVAFTTWKQGIIRQGGPADVMARRFVVPENFNSTEDNPYDYNNMVCSSRKFVDGSNPRYVKGLCMDPAINLSGTTIDLCDNGSTGVTCADLFPWNSRFDDIDMSLTTEPLAKITEWSQAGPSFGGDLSIPGNFDDLSWDNPYDVAKGHRGFIDGDFIMLLYAWSPNWLANTVGHDNYNLYVRRSFDGGQTWTTTPSTSPWTDTTGVTADGTTSCEWMGPAGSTTEYEVCTTYTAGNFERARNVSRLVGTSVTVLDPRFSKTMDSITLEGGGFLFPEDERDPSKFFIVYETGDNTTVAFGEAEPLDLYYSRAYNWGDDYELVDYDGDSIGDTFDWLEGSKLIMSGEASVTANPSGSFFYSIWNQETLDKKGNIIASDAWFRRVLYLDEDTITPPSGGGGGGKKDKTLTVTTPTGGGNSKKR